MRLMTTPSDGDVVHVKFDDNRLLPQLYGEHDKHLAQIENRLGVSLISRGNHLAISGPVDAADIAISAASTGPEMARWLPRLINDTPSLFSIWARCLSCSP